LHDVRVNHRPPRFLMLKISTLEGDEEKGLSVGDIHFVVGKCYEEGIGIQKNKPEAVHRIPHLSKSSNNGVN